MIEKNYFFTFLYGDWGLGIGVLGVGGMSTEP